MKAWIPILSVVVLLPIVTGLSWVDEPQIWLYGPGGNPADINREALWLDNPDFDTITGSSEVMSEYYLETEIANDFILELDATIRKVTWWGSYWNSFDGTPTGTGFNLRFYMDLNCLPEEAPFLEYLLPGNVCCEELASDGDQYSQYVYEYCLEVPLPAGLYWFSAQMADHEFPPQWGRLGADMTQICDSAFRSEYFAYPEWVPYPSIPVLYDASQMFEDECEATATEKTTWGAAKGLYR